MADQVYSPTAKIFHWSMAVMIVALLAIGAVMGDWPKGEVRTVMHDIHRQTGVAILLLVLPRLGYRLWHGAPPLPAAMPPMEQLIAHAGHWGLYALMFLVPISGILMSQSGDHAVSLLGWTVPTLIAPDKEMREILEDAHGFLAYSTLLLLAGHAGAALRHHFVLQDGILSRMLPQWSVKV